MHQTLICHIKPQKQIRIKYLATLLMRKPTAISMEACKKKSLKWKSWHWYCNECQKSLKVKYWYFKCAFCQSAKGRLGLMRAAKGGAHTRKNRLVSVRQTSQLCVRHLAKVKLWSEDTEDKDMVQAQIYCGVKQKKAAHAKRTKIEKET